MESEFIQLIMGLESSGWMTLGKIANPVSGQLEQNLDATRSVIETLVMLKEKTKGNLSKAEESILNGALSNLQLNYVEESTREKQEKATAPEEQKQEDKKEDVTTAETIKPKIKKSKS